jgi:hypothetical protein
LGEIKGSLKEINEMTELKLKAVNKADRVFDNKIKKINNIKDKTERRKVINNLLKTLLIFIICSCATKQTSYPSFLPPKINIGRINQTKITIEKEYGRIPFKSALITLSDGSTMLLNGGFVFDDYEVMKYIQASQQLKSCSERLKLMEQAYNSLYDNAVKVEKIWQDMLNDNQTLLDEYSFEIGTLVGTGMCLGVLYSTQVIVE